MGRVKVSLGTSQSFQVAIEFLLLSGAAYLGIRSFTPLVLGLVGMMPDGQPLMAQAPIPSRIVRAVEFEDFGHVFRVDVDSGKVTKTKVADVQPLPPGPSPQPTPAPNPPAPVIPEPGWVLLFVTPNKADAQWRDSEEIRVAAAERQAQFRSFISTESEVDDFGYRRLVRINTVPCIVILDRENRVILSRKLESLEDAIKAVKEGR